MAADVPTAKRCDYCGLPLPLRRHGSAVAASTSPQPAWCCFGCRLAAQVTHERGAHGAAGWTLTRLGLAVFFSMNVMVFTMALWTGEVYDTAEASAPPLAGHLAELFRYLALISALPVLLLLGTPILDDALAHLAQRRITTELLIVVGVAAAYVYSAISVLRGTGHVYFEVGALVLVAMTFGRWLEATGKLKTSDALEQLQRLLPDEVTRLTAGRAEQVARTALVRGDLVRVLAGERIGADGRVESAVAEIDQQVITGESHPVIKRPGDEVYGGTVNLAGTLYVRVTATSEQGTLARLIEAVRSARDRKGHYQQLADRIVARFVPAVSLLAAATLIAHTEWYGLDEGLLAALSVLLIACPCALGLATPMAVWAAMGRAAAMQVVFRDGEALERLAEVRALRFDKTGTLTTGTPEVEDAVLDSDQPDRTILAAAAAVSSASTHAFARAIARYAGDAPDHAPHDAPLDAPDGPPPLVEVESHPGRGVVARGVVPRHPDDDVPTTAEPPVYMGSPRWLADCGQVAHGRVARRIEAALGAGEPLTCLGWGGRVRAVFVFRETIRPEAAQLLAWCRREGYDVAILTGDHRARADALAARLGIAAVAELLPDEKLRAIEAARRACGPVAMIGDGINDAPALAAADVGLALGSGADVTRDTAGVCLLNNDLERLSDSIELARRTVRTIRQNLFWAFAYNVAGLAWAVSGTLNPVLAAIAMSASSLLVVTNSLRLAGSTIAPDAAPQTDSPLTAPQTDSPSSAATGSSGRTATAPLTAPRGAPRGAPPVDSPEVPHTVRPATAGVRAALSTDPST